MDSIGSNEAERQTKTIVEGYDPAVSDYLDYILGQGPATDHQSKSTQTDMETRKKEKGIVEGRAKPKRKSVPKKKTSLQKQVASDVKQLQKAKKNLAKMLEEDTSSVMQCEPSEQIESVKKRIQTAVLHSIYCPIPLKYSSECMSKRINIGFSLCNQCQVRTKAKVPIINGFNGNTYLTVVLCPNCLDFNSANGNLKVNN